MFVLALFFYYKFKITWFRMLQQEYELVKYFSCCHILFQVKQAACQTQPAHMSGQAQH